MARIDKATIDKIHDATNIVDVVSDFVSLKRRGSSYLGLCPFHNERTPSFSVSASRGIFKCFSCGKAGSAVSFLMDLEGMSYTEAMKWLGRKYGIEVQERELTSEERIAEAVRESLFAANEFAMSVFESNLEGSDEGRQIGKSYFNERGISDEMIKRFHLGYAMEAPDDLLKKAKSAGFDEKYLIETGLEVKTDRGTLYDRFKGRVIYPVHSLSGRVVAFGGRTLRKEKTVAKYVNSPESSIYSKSLELYGMYQARAAIARKKNCILVEGYMDVISMHQAGVENVVASSGTSLTEGQIRMISRFADSVTLIYDSDPAGVKASLRGINMLAAAGLGLKIVLLPEGDDPDSFAQSHTSTEVEEYIESHSQNLIGFKADVLMAEAGDDPRARGEAINDILQTIAVVPDLVEQSLYIDEFSKKTGLPAATLAAQLKKFITANKEKEYVKRQHEAAQRSLEQHQPAEDMPGQEADSQEDHAVGYHSSAVYRAEEELMRQVLKLGVMYLCDAMPHGDENEGVPMSAVDIVESEFTHEGIDFTDPLLRRIWHEVLSIRDTSFIPERAAKEAMLEKKAAESRAAGLEQIRNTARDHNEIVKLEESLNKCISREFDEAFDEFASGFVRDRLLRSDDRRIVDAVASLTSERAVLSRMYPQVDVRKQAIDQMPILLHSLKSALLKEEMKELLDELAKPHTDAEYARLQQLYLEKKEISMAIDKFAGEIVITPPERK